MLADRGAYGFLPRYTSSSNLLWTSNVRQRREGVERVLQLQPRWLGPFAASTDGDDATSVEEKVGNPDDKEEEDHSAPDVMDEAAVAKEDSIDDGSGAAEGDSDEASEGSEDMDKNDEEEGSDEEAEEKPEEEKEDPEITALKEEIASLEKEVTAKKREISAQKDKVVEAGKTGYLRLAANVENYKRRIKESKKDNEGAAMLAVTKGFFGTKDDDEASIMEVCSRCVCLCFFAHMDPELRVTVPSKQFQLRLIILSLRLFVSSTTVFSTDVPRWPDRTPCQRWRRERSRVEIA